MLPLMFSGLTFSVPLFGRDHLLRAANAMALTVCEPYRHSKRYKQMVGWGVQLARQPGWCITHIAPALTMLASAAGGVLHMEA